MNPTQLADALRNMADMVDQTESPSRKSVTSSLTEFVATLSADNHDDFYHSPEWRGTKPVEHKNKLPPVRVDDVRTGPRSVPPPKPLPKPDPKWDVSDPNFKPKKPYGEPKVPRSYIEENKKSERQKAMREVDAEMANRKAILKRKPEFSSFETFADYLEEDSRDIYTTDEAKMFARLHGTPNPIGTEIHDMDMGLLTRVLKGFGKYLELPRPENGTTIPPAVMFEVSKKLGIDEMEVKKFLQSTGDMYVSIDAICDAMTSPENS